MTLIPLAAYLKRGRVKIEVGICRGKKTYDKRQTLREKDATREVERELKRRGRGDEDRE
jgi:SsrA-binding protein